jgi:hypothetical protein
MRIEFQKCIIGFLGSVILAGCGASTATTIPACNGIAPVTGTEVTTASMPTPYKATLTGCTLIDYSVSATVGGTPGMSVIVDSGSSTLAVASALCTNCTSITPVYQSSPSTQYTCDAASSTYGDGTGWNALLFNDLVQVGSIPNATMSLAGITSQTSTFFSSSDCSLGNSGTNSSQGIMGLAGPNIAISGTTSYLDALNAQQAFPPIFAVQLCMTGGNIWFGNYDPTYMTSTPAYTPILQTGSFYYVNLTNMLVNSTPVGVTGSSFADGVIVDTGTSVGVFPQTIYDTLTSNITANADFAAQIGSSSWFDNGECTPASSMTEAELDAALPTLNLQLQQVGGGTITVALLATTSYLDMHEKGGVKWYCPGIAPDGGVGPDIIGGSLLRSQIVIFDRNSAQPQIGFAPQNAPGATNGCPL